MQYAILRHFNVWNNDGELCREVHKEGIKSWPLSIEQNLLMIFSLFIYCTLVLMCWLITREARTTSKPRQKKPI
jgi:hypothetical protein